MMDNQTRDDFELCVACGAIHMLGENVLCPITIRDKKRQKMQDSKIKATARVELTIEITVPDNWGHDCTVAQVHKQASDSAMKYLQDLVRAGHLEVVGQPKIKVITSGE